MKETRAGKYGRSLAAWINYTIQGMSEKQRNEYRSRFLEELGTYSFEPRKKGQPRNQGCVHELFEIADADITNPKHLALLVKESLHLMYQKQTSARVLEALRESLTQT
jgi:hypothetical protein